MERENAGQHDAEVVIVGGGPVGMGLTIELGQRDIRCIVVERYPHPQPIPKGQNLTPRTMEHFHFWGAEKELRDSARDLERARGEFNDDATAKRNEEMSRLQKTLGEEVRSYAKAQNYDLILSGETVVYAAPSYDITPAILAALQARTAAAPATSAPPAATKPAPPAKPQTH